MTESAIAPGHSAEVEMRLIVQGRAYPLRQLNPAACVLRELADLSPGAATIELLVDGVLQRWDVEIRGTASPSTTVSFSN